MPLFRIRKLDDSGQYGRHLYSGKLRFSFLSLFGDQGAYIQRLVPDQRKWAGRVHRHRRKDRVNIFFKILVCIRFLALCHLFMFCHDLKAGLLHQREQGTVVSRILDVYQFMCFFPDHHKLLLRRHSCNVFFRIFCMHHIL